MFRAGQAWAVGAAAQTGPGSHNRQAAATCILGPRRPHPTVLLPISVPPTSGQLSISGGPAGSPSGWLPPMGLFKPTSRCQTIIWPVPQTYQYLGLKSDPSHHTAPCCQGAWLHQQPGCPAAEYPAWLPCILTLCWLLSHLCCLFLRAELKAPPQVVLIRIIPEHVFNNSDVSNEVQPQPSTEAFQEGGILVCPSPATLHFRPTLGAPCALAPSALPAQRAAVCLYSLVEFCCKLT